MLFKSLQEDIVSIRSRDPAAHSTLEVILCYPGLHALIFYRMAHWCWQNGLRVLGRFISHVAKIFTGIEIHPGATIGRRLFIDHGTGVVIGETAIIGDDVTLYHGVTLGGTSLHKGKRHPTLEDGVIIGSGAQVLGPITVSKGARVGANAVVLTDVPPGVTMVGIPARMAMRKPKPGEAEFCAYGLVDDTMPDPVARAIDSLRTQVDALLARVAELEAERDGAVTPRLPTALVDGEEGEDLDPPPQAANLQ
ncbi:serine O-acetyltransferase [Magnetospirillum aberrantis]|uniref:Serine acetyltransferase n=1 Tax=Magnetospirillum aberrantis SpK TaxID=908842 RepID=A0A7C9QTS1_9PROT|nr:serine O-acetyltransferase [Magnetospirillum aberrantis]NFV79176.1 serine O-acetyltransferase [Magnetospirillum aberrantis SpK]